MDHRSIDLTKNQLKSLKSIQNGNFDIPRDDANFLIDLGLIYLTTLPTDQNAKYALTEEAVMYLNFVPKDRLRTWYPYVVSTLALIIAIISLIKTF